MSEEVNELKQLREEVARLTQLNSAIENHVITEREWANARTFDNRLIVGPTTGMTRTSWKYQLD
jgi:hypothetical protein